MQASIVEVRVILENVHYPVTKESLLQQAIKHGASRIVIEDLKRIPDRKYTRSIDIFRGLATDDSMCKLTYIS